jgi:hypothetical protein
MPMVAIVAAIITFAVYIVDYKADGTERNK